MGWSFISQVMYFTSHVFHKKTHVFHKKICEIHDLWNTWPLEDLTRSCISQVMYFTSHGFHKKTHVFHKSWSHVFHKIFTISPTRFPRPEEVQETRRISSQNEGHQGWRPWFHKCCSLLLEFKTRGLNFLFLSRTKSPSNLTDHGNCNCRCLWSKSTFLDPIG